MDEGHARRIRRLGRAAAVAVSVVASMALINGAFAAVPLTKVSQDPYTNTSAYHQTAGRARHVLVRLDDRLGLPDRPVLGRRLGRHRLGHLDRQRADVDQRLPARDHRRTPTRPGRTLRISDPSIAYDPKHDVWLAQSLTVDNEEHGRSSTAPPTAASRGATRWSSRRRRRPATTTRPGSPATHGRPARTTATATSEWDDDVARRHRHDEHLDRRREDLDARPPSRRRHGLGGQPRRRSRTARSSSRSRPTPARSSRSSRRTAARPTRARTPSRRQPTTASPAHADRAAPVGGGRRARQRLRGLAGLPVPQRLLVERHRDEHVEERARPGRAWSASRSTRSAAGSTTSSRGSAWTRRRRASSAHLGADLLLLPEANLHARARASSTPDSSARTDGGATWATPTQILGPLKLGWLPNAGRLLRGRLHLHLVSRRQGVPGDRQRDERARARSGRSRRATSSWSRRRTASPRWPERSRSATSHPFAARTRTIPSSGTRRRSEAGRQRGGPC